MRDFFENAETRAGWARHHLARIGLSLDTNTTLGAMPDDPAIEARRARETKERLAREDARFGVTMGCTLASEYKIPRPVMTAGDAEGDRDVS